MTDAGTRRIIRACDIADLAMPVATLGAIRTCERIGDDVFESTISIAEIVYELHPD
ncbi:MULTISPECIES: hypothetical protein [unclassified Sphingomonas]|jgi:hypothetical protein|uniref:hypothetical protein n=1 Tax=unclassified Sphingomonas TaxID=196159 RepID=UPI000AAAE450|nr:MULTISPECIES: hypothetical protein [unclassified Sphingomonas]MCH4893148.1 hypothetical protein [Sphingomonas sp. SFZ2018-12]